MTRVGVIGAAGRMGSTVCDAVRAADDLELVAAVDSSGGPGLATALEALTDAGSEVAVDFTVPGAAVGNAEWCAAHGVHAVIGTTGIDEAAIGRLRRAFPPGTGGLGCVVAPNFAIGAVLMMHFAELAA
ncbi:MAG: 4-hydroxy-tetrahydrodipicolinate reductase, partial [Acidimicrobiales bacterium]|nr:4-hydroxy-tetrahydrodipicolinate reductase [Acidimicrobiales bacterium]